MIGRAAILGGMSQSDQQVNAYQLRIVLRRTSPHMWRRVVVRNDSTLGQLHQAVQALFGWRAEETGCVWRCDFPGISDKLLKWQSFINLEWCFGM
jgi:hypothetical protein